MGKLAERYRDAARSGVYRVTSAEIPLRAASEAGARVLETGDVEMLAEVLRKAIKRGERQPHVAMIDDPALRGALEELASHCRENALPFFALLVDPAGTLDLPGLYKERTASSDA